MAEKIAKHIIESLWQTELDKVRAEGYAAGLETAAKWHDDSADFLRDGQFHNEVTRAAIKVHERAAEAIHALKEKPKP